MSAYCTDKPPEGSDGWSDDDGDEYLAKALASDEYLQGSGVDSPSTPLSFVLPTLRNGGTSTDSSSTGAKGTILVHHPLCELHDIPDHPERPARVRVIMKALTTNFPQMRTLLAPEATIEQILRFHDQQHVDGILRRCTESEKRGRLAASAGAGGGSGGSRNPLTGIVRIDEDTSLMPLSRAAIFRAAGAACFAVDEVMSGGAANAFCCVRPPGHHAEPAKAMGFCFFNNAPIGALHAKAVHGAKRVAVIDVDVHHGNGTQAFFSKDPTTFYASTHQGPDFYPGTGHDEIKGVEGNIVNVSMEDGEGSVGFRSAYSEKILPALEAFGPDLIVISAGFDAHVDDPLAGINLDEEDYRWVTLQICAVAERVCGGRVVSILEGGYNLRAIAYSAVAHVDALRQAAAAAAPPPATPTVTKAAEGGGDQAVSMNASPLPSGTTIAAKYGEAVNRQECGDAGSALTGDVANTGGDGHEMVVAPRGEAAAAAAAAAGAAATVVEVGEAAEGSSGESVGVAAGYEYKDIDLMLAQLSVQDADPAEGEHKEESTPLPL